MYYICLFLASNCIQTEDLERLDRNDQVISWPERSGHKPGEDIKKQVRYIQVSLQAIVKPSPTVLLTHGWEQGEADIQIKDNVMWQIHLLHQ